MSDSEDDFDDDPSLDEEPIHRAAREGDLAVLRRELDAGYRTWGTPRPGPAGPPGGAPTCRVLGVARVFFHVYSF